MATTPPPPSPSSLRVPAAPLHGAGYDRYGPYPTRSSARIASQRAARSMERTPEPICPGSPSKMRSRGSPRRHPRLDEDPISRSWKSIGKDVTESEMSITISQEASDDYRYSHRDPETCHASRLSHSHSHPHSTATQGLPTPAKTPSKRSIQGDLSSTSRTLFPPTSKMQAKKLSPFSLESFEAPSADEIPIFTDSRDRIPVSNLASDNPFASHADTAKTPSPGKKSKRAATRVQTEEGSRSLRTPTNAASKRREESSADEEPLPAAGDDGMTMIFRGRKKYIQFSELDEETDDEDDLGLFASRPELLEANPDILKSVKPLTRGSIKPRVLFPKAAEGSGRREEEVAEEDVQEADTQPPAIPDITPAVAPESPQQPGATRSLRSNARFATQGEDASTGTTTADTKRRRTGPFDHWPRKKQAIDEMSSPASPMKREAGSSSTPVAPASAKKTRSARGGATAPSSL